MWTFVQVFTNVDQHSVWWGICFGGCEQQLESCCHDCTWQIHGATILVLSYYCSTESTICDILQICSRTVAMQHVESVLQLLWTIDADVTVRCAALAVIADMVKVWHEVNVMHLKTPLHQLPTIVGLTPW